MLKSIAARWGIVLSGDTVCQKGLEEFNKINTHLTNKGEHVTSDVTLCETGTSIREEVFPLSLERRILMNITQSRIILHDDILCQIRLQAPSPFSKRAGIVWVASMSSMG